MKQNREEQMAFHFGQRRTLRRRGDRYRDAGLWPRAEKAYSAYLAHQPDDAPIYVQLGHVLKEQGKSAEAADAYREGAARLGEDADSLMHWANALYALGRHRDAADAYRRCFAARPDAAVLRRLMLLSDPSTMPDTTLLAEGSLLFSVQDLFDYLAAHATLSGIQRVQAGILSHLFDEASADTHFILGYSESLPDTLLPGEYWRIDEQSLKTVLDHVFSDAVDRDAVRLSLARCEAGATRVRPTAGSAIVVLGAFWSYGNAIDRLLASQRDGVTLGVCLYDLIPLTHPSFCDAGLVAAFGRALAEMAAVVDFVITISDCTRTAMLAYMEATGRAGVRVMTVPLARCAPGGGSAGACAPAILDALHGRPYVAYVSTIEGRKNHIYVVEAWQRMIADGIDVPDLLFVGRLGWRIDPLIERLEETDWLDRRVHLVHDLSDGELNAVYAQSRFTLFTSFVEGWGLPVGESLSHGRPCIASGVSAIPEVGGELVDYIDPTDLESGIAGFRRMICDADYRTARSAEIVRTFVPRDWNDVGRDFVAAVRELAHAGAVETLPVAIPEQRMMRLDEGAGSSATPADYARNPTGLLFDSFYPPHADGMWMRGRQGRIRLAQGLAPNRPVTVELGLIAAPWSGHCAIRISSGDPSRGGPPIILPIAALSASEAVIWHTKVDDAGNLTVDLLVEGAFGCPPETPRRFAIGVSRIGYAGG